MRRILKATTALVTCVSLIMPQIALAQDQGQQQGQPPIIRKEQQQKGEKPKPQNQGRAEKQEAPKPPKQKAETAGQPQRKQQQGNAEQPRKPQPQPAKQAQPQPKRQPEPKRQQPQQAQQEKPKPQAQPAQPKNGNGAKQPEPAPKKAQAEPRPAAEPKQPQENRRPAAAKPAPEKQPRPQANANQPGNGQGQNGKPQQNGVAPRPAPAGGKQPPREVPANADELRRAMERKEQPNTPPAASQAENRPNAPGNPPAQRDGTAPKAAPQPQQNAGRLQNNPRQPKPMTPAQLRERIKASNGETTLPPPEATGQQNDIARRAAQGMKPAPAAALAAQGDGQGQVTERKIAKDDRRRSDQDFGTRVQDGMQRGEGQRPMTNEELRRDLERRERNLSEAEREAQRREDRRDRRDAWLDGRDNRRGDGNDARDDNNDNASDIAKLLLAGAAGFAVGKMMSGNREVALNTGDRAVLTLPDGSQQIVRDDNALLYQPGSDVRTENYQDGSTRTTVLRADGSRVVTIRDADMNILRRTLVRQDGSETRLIDDTTAQPVQVATLPAPQPVEYSTRPWQEDELRQALLRESATDRRFTLGQIRDIPEVRSLVAPVNVPEINFDTGSAALSSAQAEQLATLGKVIGDSIAENPNEVFMIEGYTDAVGSNAANLALSDRRAESVALALTEYFQVPPENMVVQGYGEQFLLINSDGPERENRRVGIRRITDLLEQG